MSFTETWYFPQGLDALELHYRRCSHIGGMVVEVGCWEGRSTCHLANVAYPTVIHAVDTWEGSPGEISAELAKDRDVYARFCANVKTLTQGNVVPHRMGWREWFAAHDGSPIRFLHIDATHTYDEVRANIEAALPFIPAGGIICGDDAHHGPVIDAARDTLGRVTIDASLWVWEKPDGD